MRASIVVMPDVLGEDLFQVASGEYEQVVEAVLPDSAHPPFGEGVRPRGAHRGEDRLGADRGEDIAQAGGELGVAVADEEPHPPACVFEIGTEVACYLGHPGAARIVSGVMRKAIQHSRGTSLAKAATIARSDQLNRGRAAWRRRTDSC